MFYGSFSLEHNTELQKNSKKTYKTSTYICVHKVIVFNFVKVLLFFKCNKIMFKCQIIAVLLRIMSNIESRFGNKDWKKIFYVNLIICLVTGTTLYISDNNNISTQKLCLQTLTYTHSKTSALTVVPFNHPYLFRLP